MYLIICCSFCLLLYLDSNQGSRIKLHEQDQTSCLYCFTDVYRQNVRARKCRRPLCVYYRATNQRVLPCCSMQI